MTFRDYVESLDGKQCNVYVREMSAQIVPEMSGRWALTGYMKTEDDFILISHDRNDFSEGTAVRVDDILVIEVGDDDDDEEPASGDDIERDFYSSWRRGNE